LVLISAVLNSIENPAPLKAEFPNFSFTTRIRSYETVIFLWSSATKPPNSIKLRVCDHNKREDGVERTSFV